MKVIINLVLVLGIFHCTKLPAQLPPLDRTDKLELAIIVSGLHAVPMAKEYENATLINSQGHFKFRLSGRTGYSFGASARRRLGSRSGLEFRATYDQAGYYQDTWSMPFNATSNTETKIHYYSLGVLPYLLTGPSRKFSLQLGGVASYYKETISFTQAYQNGQPDFYGIQHRQDSDWPIYASAGLGWQFKALHLEQRLSAQFDYGLREIVSHPYDEVFKDYRIRINLTLHPVWNRK